MRDMWRFVPVYVPLFDPAHYLHPFARREKACAAWAWIEMIGMSNWRDGAPMPGLQRGQFRHARSFLAKRWRWSPATVGRFFDELLSRGMIRIEPGRGNVPDTVTIVSYDRYAVMAEDGEGLEGLRVQNVGEALYDYDATATGGDNVRTAQAEANGDEGDERRDLALVLVGDDGRPDPSDEFSYLTLLRNSTTERERASNLIAAHVARAHNGERPDPAVITEQAAYAKVLARKYSGETLARGFWGMRFVWPFSDGDPWTLRHLLTRGRLDEAVQAARTGGRQRGSAKRTRDTMGAIDTALSEVPL